MKYNVSNARMGTNLRTEKTLGNNEITVRIYLHSLQAHPHDSMTRKYMNAKYMQIDEKRHHLFNKRVNVVVRRYFFFALKLSMFSNLKIYIKSLKQIRKKSTPFLSPPCFKVDYCLKKYVNKYINS